MSAGDETSRTMPRRSPRALSGRARQRLDAWLERFSKFARGEEPDAKTFSRALFVDPGSVGDAVIARLRSDPGCVPFSSFADPEKAAKIVAA